MSFIRLALPFALTAGLAACSGGAGSLLGGLNPITGGSIQCDPGTQVQLANPQPGQTGVSNTLGQIVIVANGSNNSLYSGYNQWNLVLADQFGDRITGSNLTLTSYTNGPHPYPSDFYYSSTVGQLPTGATWTVQLTQPGANCLPVPLNSFST
jgi:hypothetical protein